MAKAGAKAQTIAFDDTGLPAAGGARVVAFIERHCRITKGRDAGKLIVLRAWQVAIIYALFGGRIGDLKRPRRAYLQFPRKNGKTALAACLGLYVLVADGEQGAEVYSIAGKLKQAILSWSIARRMVELDPHLSQVVQIFGGRGTYAASKLYVPTTDSTFEPLPSAGDPDALHGLNPSFVLFDEVHAQADDLVWEAVSLAMGARDRPLLLGITTPGHNQTSLAYELYEYGRAHGDDDPDFYFIAFEAPDGCEWHDETAWHAANPALGDFLSLDDMRAAVATTPEHAFRKFRLGQWVAGEEAWISAEAWDALADPDAGLVPGEPIVIGFDGSLSDDSTALVGTSVDLPARVEILGLWEQPGIFGWRVPRHEVQERVDQLFADYDVRAMLCDPPYWAQEIAAWAQAYGPTRVLEFPTYSRARMAPAAGTFRTAVYEGRIRHTGDKRLRRHVLNAIVRHSPAGDYPTKPDKDSPRKIDAAIAAVIAVAHAAVVRPKPRAKPRAL